MSDFRKIHIQLDASSTEIICGQGALQSFAQCVAEKHPCKRVALVSDSNVGPTYGDMLKKNFLELGFDVCELMISPGDMSKSPKTVSKLWEALAKNGFTRHDILISVGGGVVSDIAGFVAATYMRGIKFACVPTSVLACCDAAIGGKNAINLPHAKNLIGSFHHPFYVCIDPRTFLTLEAKEWTCGFAEIAKSSIVAPNTDFSSWLVENAKSLVGHTLSIVEDAIYRAAQFKASIVCQDPFDTKSIRACLNYGHTLAHAIEAASGYGQISHGQAVAEGIRFATRLAVEVLDAPVSFVNKVDALLDSLGLELLHWTSTPDELLSYIKRDKKNNRSSIRFVLADNFASYQVVEVDEEVLYAHLQAWCIAKRRLCIM